MPWDKWAGRCVTIGATGSLYGVKVFEVAAGAEGVEAVVTKQNGTMLDLNDHMRIIGKAAIIVRWNREETQVEVSKLYLDCSPQQEAIFRRLFVGFGGQQTPPKYGGIVPISIDESGGRTFVKVGDVGTLTLNSSGFSGSASQQIIQAGPGYSEVATIQDGSGSEWDDGEFKFTQATFASLGTFHWNSPADRPAPAPTWWLATK